MIPKSMYSNDKDSCIRFDIVVVAPEILIFALSLIT